jgi:hypothetical protein
MVVLDHKRITGWLYSITKGAHGIKTKGVQDKQGV